MANVNNAIATADDQAMNTETKLFPAVELGVRLARCEDTNYGGNTQTLGYGQIYPQPTR